MKRQAATDDIYDLRSSLQRTKDLISKIRARLKTMPTDREEQVLKFLRQGNKTGLIPNQSEIARHFDFSRERARQLMGRLRDKGFIKGSGRNVEVIVGANGKAKK